MDEAISLYSDAIEIDPDNHVLYSNRSAAYASCKKYSEALDDAEEALKLRPDFVKVTIKGNNNDLCCLKKLKH